ncbi:MAG TPA: hypothetical protein VFO34_02840 [Candidatus Acidoferrales bacterium]|nr:hypothetical protein [Candidatus Acidoferrales bacterium]
MDAERRKRLVDKLEMLKVRVGQSPGPTVSLEDFFDGNDDVGSIGCNLLVHPGVDRFYRIFKEIRWHPRVQDVRVEIKDLVDEHSWPFADTVFVLTSMDRHELYEAAAELNPDEVGEFIPANIPVDLQPLKDGMKVLGIWWD